MISESILSTALSQNGVWKDKMIDLDLGSTRTNTDSEKWLKSCKGSGVNIGSGSGSKSRSWNSSPHFLTTKCDLTLVIQVQEWQVWESKLTLKYYSSSKEKEFNFLEFELSGRKREF